MSPPRFIELFAWEWRRVGRSMLLWSTLAILAASFVWGALGTAHLHATQSEAQQRALAAHAQWQASTTERADAYRSPVTPAAGEVAYWQDPTSVSGYSQYFVRQPALKPHLPLSPLAAGVSDLAPGRLDIRLNTLFGFADSYDFENPRGLALGRFDLGFAVVYLLPIGLLLLFALLVTFERDRGMLPLVAAQAVHPRTWIGARVAAILAWAIPVLVLALITALATAGVPLGAVAASLAMAALIVVLYMLFWSGVALVVLARQPGAGQALGMFAGIWVGLTTGVPLATSAVAGALDPVSSSVGYVDAQRSVGDQVQAERTAIIARTFAARPDLREHAGRADTLDHATRLTFLTPEVENRLGTLRAAIEAHRMRQARLAPMVGIVMPSVGVQAALQTLAGTDPARQRAFEAQARSYQLELRERVYPLVQAEITKPQPPSPRTTRGRLSLSVPMALPSFVLRDQPDAARVLGVLPVATSLAGLALLMGILGFVRMREWRVAG